MKKAVAVVLSLVLILALIIPVTAFSTVAVKSIKLDATQITLTVGQTRNLKVTFTPANTTQKFLTYITGNKSIASVDKNGKITAVNAGTTVITVMSTSNADIRQECSVTVKPALEPVKLTWYLLSNAQPDDSKVYAEANKYIKSKINATVSIYPLNMGEYSDKIKVKLAGQEPIDLVFTSSWLNSYSENVAKGALQPLDDLLVNYGTDLKASIPQKYWEMSKIKKTGDGKARVYGVPNYQIMASVNGIAFRKDLVEKYKLTDKIKNLKNYDDLTPIFQVIKDNEPNVYCLADMNLTPEGKYELDTKPYPYEAVANSITVNLKNFKVLALDDPEVAATELKLSKIRRDWYNKGFIDKNAITNNVDLEPYKKQGKLFCYELGACKPGVEIEEKTKYGYDIIALQERAPVTSVGQVTATMNGIPTSSENPERAMMMLNLINTDKYLYNLMNFGFEKTHYTKISSNMIEVKKDSKFNPSMAWALGNQFNAFVQKGQPTDVWEQTKKINDNAIVSPLEGFSFNAEPVKTELAQMATVGLKYGKIIGNGAVDPEEYIAKRNKELNNNSNMQKVKAEVQKQLDEWKKLNKK